MMNTPATININLCLSQLNLGLKPFIEIGFRLFKRELEYCQISRSFFI